MRLGEGGSESETSELSSIIFVQPGDVRYYTLARNIDGGIQLDILILMTLCCTTKNISVVVDQVIAQKRSLIQS